MIIPTESGDAKRREFEVANNALAAGMPSDDPPPTYTPQPTEGDPRSSEFVGPLMPNVQSSNFVSVLKGNGSVKGSWFLDPLLPIPKALLPPLLPGETEETRKNFNVLASNGTVDIDLTLLSSDLSTQNPKILTDQKRTNIFTKAFNGNIKIAIHAPYLPRLPVLLNVCSLNGAISLTIPRSFQGIITITTQNGNVKFLGDMENAINITSDVNKTRRCFLGDFSALVDDEPWEGDEMVVETSNGGVKIQYDDEATESTRQRGFLGRIFGL